MAFDFSRFRVALLSAVVVAVAAPVSPLFAQAWFRTIENHDMPAPAGSIDGGSHVQGGATASVLPRWRPRDTGRVLSRSDTIWYANGAWKCRRTDGTSGTILGVSPPNLLYKTANMNGRQNLDSAIRAPSGAPLGRQVDSGIVVCR